MKVGIMQPYLFPYLGYFQLINAVDTFVIYDDVQYIKNGWINRNRIQLNGKEILFTFGIKRDSSKKNINERFYSEKTFESTKDNFFKTITLAYKKAPFFSETNELINKIFTFASLNVAEFNTNSLKMICHHIGIDTKFLLSSEFQKDNTKKSQDRVIEINKLLDSDCYINLIGGIELYSPDVFMNQGIPLKFIGMNDVKYPQFNEKFIPSLSIIDVLMCNSKKNVVEHLINEYILV